MITLPSCKSLTYYAAAYYLYSIAGNALWLQPICLICLYDAPILCLRYSLSILFFIFVPNWAFNTLLSVGTVINGCGCCKDLNNLIMNPWIDLLKFESWFVFLKGYSCISFLRMDYLTYSWIWNMQSLTNSCHWNIAIIMEFMDEL